jgi:hypothetical protein
MSVRDKKTHFLTNTDVQAIRRDLRHASNREVARKWHLSDAYVWQLKHYTRRAV